MDGEEKSIDARLEEALDGGYVDEMVDVLKTLPPEQLKQAAEVSRTAGNNAFKRGEYQQAIQLYSQALLATPSDAKLYANRSACNQALGDHMQALQDAAQCTRLDPKWAKGFYRMGVALMSLEQYKEAYAVFQKGLGLNPNNGDMRRKASEANSKVTEQAQIEALMPSLDPEGHQQAETKGKKKKSDLPEVDIDLYRPEFSLDLIKKVALAYKKKGKLADDDTRGHGMSRLIDLSSQVNEPRRHIREWTAVARSKGYAEALRAVLQRVVANNGSDQGRPLVLHTGVGLGLAPVLAALSGADVATMHPNRFMLTAVQQCAQRASVPSGHLRPILCSGERVTGDHFRHAFATRKATADEGAPPTPDNMDLAPTRLGQLIVAELFDPGLLALRLLPTVQHLRALAAENVTVFPYKITVHGAMVSKMVKDVSGINVSKMNDYRWCPHYQSVQLSMEEDVLITESFDIFSFDLRCDAAPTESKALSPLALRSGEANGVAFWMTLHLDEHNPAATVCTGPRERGAFYQAVQFFDPVPVREGESVSVVAVHNKTRIWFDVPSAKVEAKRFAIPAWHFQMLADEKRSAMYREAMDASVKRMLATADNGKGCTVIDMGAGSGLMAACARRSGATRVIALEASAHLRRTAGDILKDNNVDGVELVEGDVRRLKLRKETARAADIPAGEQSSCTTAARAHVLVAELLDYGALGEGIIPLVKHAKATFMREISAIIPCRLRIHAMLVEHTQGTVAGVDLSPWDRYLWSADYLGIDMEALAEVVRPVSAPVDLFDFDFSDDSTLVESEKEVSFDITLSGTANAVVFYFSAWLSEDHVLSSAPFQTDKSHWLQAVQYFDPHTVSEGGQFRLRARTDTIQVMFAIADGQEDAKIGTCLDVNWFQMHEQQAKQFSTLHQGLAQDLNERAVAGGKAMMLATQPGLFSLAPDDTQNFAMSFCG